MDARPATDNPLGLNLDFLYGRGYLWAEHENVSDWVTLERLRMEIPDLSFPFDVRGGLARFRDTRCLLRELDLRISEVGLVDVLRRLSDDLDGFSDLEVRFLDGVILFALRVRAFGSDTFLTFKLGAMPGNAGTDTVRLVAHDFRAYGPLPCSARQLVHTLLSHAVGSEAVAGVGRGTSYAVELHGAAIVVRPLKLLLLHVFARHGWKLPNLSRVVMGDLLCRPGGAMLRARSLDEQWTRDKSTGDGSAYLASAIAANEARTLFESGDAATFAGRNVEALRSYQSFQDRHGTHPGLVHRLLDVLLLDPNPANIAEAEALCNDLEERDARSLVAAMGRARLAEIGGNKAQALTRWVIVSELLGARGETLDRALCDVVVARLLVETDPESATHRLKETLRAEPRNLAALLQLREIYERTDQPAPLEDVLKRLTGVAPDTDSLVETYVALARHLMSTQNQVAEARAFLERALRVAPNRFEVLDALGETWVKSGDPARAVKTLGSAATAARDRGDLTSASRLVFRVGRLWAESLGNREQALMQVRRALDLWDEGAVNDPLERASQLRYAAVLCEEDRQHSEAIANWTEALAALQLAEARADSPNRIEVRRALAETHRDVAAAYRARGRHDVAITHERRLVEMDPTDVEAIDTLEDHFRDEGGLVAFVDVLNDAVERVGRTAESLALRTRLAERLAELGRTNDAIHALEQALRIAPGAERVRRVLAALLVEAGEPKRLQEVLLRLRAEVQQREVQWAIAIELGDLAIDVLQDPEAAVVAYEDATHALPTRRAAYTWCRFVLEQLAAQRGWDGESPLGNNIGRDLLTLWQRLAENAPSSKERNKLLDEVSGLATSMGDDAWAQSAILQREALDSTPNDDVPSGEFGGEMFEDSWSEAEASRPPAKQFVRDADTRMVTSETDVDKSNNETTGPWQSRTPAGLAQREVETLEVTRMTGGPTGLMQQNSDFDANLATAHNPEPVFTQVESNPRLVTSSISLNKDDGDTLDFHDIDGNDPRQPRLSGLLTMKARVESPADENLDAFRAGFEEATRRPPGLPDLDDVDENSPLGRVLRRSTTRIAPSLSGSTRAVSSSDLGASDPADPLETEQAADIEKSLSDARKAEDYDAVANALETLLTTDDLSDERRCDLTFELAELLFYDLEQGDRALPWLLVVRQLDPHGYGARPGVLNAIEAIYEERGSLEGRVEILKARLEQSSNEDMADTYRLLLAQLEWEDRADRVAAQTWLDLVLAHDDRHEGARRLLAQIAQEASDWEGATEHLRIALSVAGDGLDAVELRKRLALIHLDHLDQPDDALRHFRTVQAEAPHDAAILDGIRRCQTMLGDWDGYVSSLREELRLLLGRTLPVEDVEDDWVSEVDVSNVPEPLRASVGQVLADIARVVQDEMGNDADAHFLWGKVAQLWPEHVEAIERRIDLDRKLEQHEDLVSDLEAYALILLDPDARFEAQLESALTRAEHLEDTDGARQLLERALEEAESGEKSPALLKDARKALKGWTKS